MKFTRKDCQPIGERAAALLRQLESELGVKIDYAGGTYDNQGRATLKFSFEPVAEDGTVMTKEASAFLQLCHMDGLKPEHLGQTIPINGKPMKLIGYRTASWKMPYLLEDVVTHKKIVAASQLVKRGLGIAS